MSPIPLLRTPDPHGHAKVSFVELFFDLVFVFAVTQLSHTLIGHFAHDGVTLGGALQTGFLMLAVWWVWVFTSWVTNWLDPERLPVRICLFAMMLGGLLMSVSLPQAFGERALMFAVSFSSIQVGRTLFFLWAARGGDAILVRNFQRIGVWLVISAVLWIAGALSPELRVPLWVTALAIEVVGPSAGFFVPGLGRSTTSDWTISGGHLAERCALFVIIALGESLLVTGATFAAEPLTSMSLLAFLVSFAGSLALWWLYFDTTNEFASGRIAHSDDPGRLARLAYTYLHLPIVAGIIVNAAADEFVLAHPDGHTDLKTALCLLGGVGLYAIGVGLFKRAVVGRWPWSHGVAVLVLAAAGPFVHAWTPVATSAFACAVLVALAAWERHSRAQCLVPDSAREDDAPSIGE